MISDPYRDLLPAGRRMVRVLLAAHDAGRDSEPGLIKESALTESAIADRVFVQLLDRGVMQPFLAGLYGFASAAEAERARAAVTAWDAAAWAMQTPRRRLSALAV